MSEKEKQGRLQVRRQYKGKDEESVKDEYLEARRFPEGTHPAWVGAKYGATVNIGNYESVRIEASVSLPCYTEEIDAAFEAAWSMVEDEVRPQVRDARGAKRG